MTCRRDSNPSHENQDPHDSTRAPLSGDALTFGKGWRRSSQAQQHCPHLCRCRNEAAGSRLLKRAAAHQRKARVVQLRGSWVPVEPRGWKADMNVTAMWRWAAAQKRRRSRSSRAWRRDRKGFSRSGGLENPLVDLAEYHNSGKNITCRRFAVPPVRRVHAEHAVLRARRRQRRAPGEPKREGISSPFSS
jgi:hypothetical protein